jgi:phosphogluconate dehydratase
VLTVAGPGLRRYQPALPRDGKLVWREGPAASLNTDILRPSTPSAGRHRL